MFLLLVLAMGLPQSQDLHKELMILILCRLLLLCVVSIDELAVDEDLDALAVNTGLSHTKSNSGGATLEAGANEILLCFFLIVVALNGTFRLHASRCHSLFFTFKPDRSLPQLQVVTSSDIST